MTSTSTASVSFGDPVEFKNFDDAYDTIWDSVNALKDDLTALRAFHKDTLAENARLKAALAAASPQTAPSEGSPAPDTLPPEAVSDWVTPRPVLVTTITSPRLDPSRRIIFGETPDGSTVFITHQVAEGILHDGIEIGDVVRLTLRRNLREEGTNFMAIRYLGRVV